MYRLPSVYLMVLTSRIRTKHIRKYGWKSNTGKVSMPVYIIPIVSYRKIHKKRISNGN